MDDELSDDTTVFLQMARDFPLRTGIFTFGLPLFGLLQLVNGYINQESLLVIGGFVALLVLFSAQLTRYQLANYRRAQLTEQWLEQE
ncbi:MAG: hypothetical protein ABEI77_01595 [Halorientalis sp.]